MVYVQAREYNARLCPRWLPPRRDGASAACAAAGCWMARRLAARGERLAGDIGLRGMPRLRKAAGVEQRLDACAAYELVFSRDGQGRCCITLHLEVGLEWVCQRCLGLMRLEFGRHSSLGVVSGAADARRLSRDCEPVETDAAGYIDLGSLIEEEILLSMPFAPKHPEGCC